MEENAVSLDWLKADLFCNGHIVRPELVVEEISDSDMGDICLRMNLIYSTENQKICGGRQPDLYMIESLDDLWEALKRKESCRIQDWTDFIADFADRYKLNGKTYVSVSVDSVNGHRYMFETFDIPFVEVD